MGRMGGLLAGATSLLMSGPAASGAFVDAAPDDRIDAAGSSSVSIIHGVTDGQLLAPFLWRTGFLHLAPADPMASGSLERIEFAAFGVTLGTSGVDDAPVFRGSRLEALGDAWLISLGALGFGPDVDDAAAGLLVADREDPVHLRLDPEGEPHPDAVLLVIAAMAGLGLPVSLATLGVLRHRAGVDDD